MLLRKYETILIVNPTLGEEGMDKALGRVREAFEKTGGREVRLEDWGTRKLAFPLKHQMRGRYLYVLFLATNETVAELERLLGITESVMKFQSILLEDRVDAEAFDFAAAAAELTDLGRAASGKTEGPTSGTSSEEAA